MWCTVNKFKPRDKITLKRRFVKQHIRNISTYIKVDGTLDGNDVERLFCMMGSIRKRDAILVGVVVGYGARIDADKSRFLCVNVKNKFGSTGLMFVTEDDVKKI